MPVGKKEAGRLAAKRPRSPSSAPAPKKAAPVPKKAAPAPKKAAPASKKAAPAPKKAASVPKKAATAPATANLIGNRTVGPLKRTAEVLALLEKKKTKEEIWSQTTPFERKTRDADFDPASMFKLVTWNVAGLRGLLKKDARAIETLLTKENIDVLCLQETKLNLSDVEANRMLGVVPGYSFLDHPCEVKKGYSGVRTYVRKGDSSKTVASYHEERGPQRFTVTTGTQDWTGMKCPNGFSAGEGDHEGRVLTTLSGCGTLAVVNTYVPNSGMTLDRLAYRTNTFDKDIRLYLQFLEKFCSFHDDDKPNAPAGVIWTGDLNVAERDYDRYYSGTFQTMQACAGFTPEERASFRETLHKWGGVDVFRALYPTAAPVYSFWSNRLRGREKGLGWRIDYFVVSRRLMPFVIDCFPMPSVMGSDHCPMQLWLRRRLA